MNQALPTITLALLLGLRHGLAPDHLAAIDGLTMRARPASAPWMGALFALGHGLTLLLIVTLANLASARLQPASDFLRAMEWLEWLPGILLLSLATLNARSLLRPAQQRRMHGIGARLLAPLTTVQPLTAFGIGMLFALGVESILHALAWGYAAPPMGMGSSSALQVAAVFVLGMTVTDALDGYATARIAINAGQRAIQQFRRRIGWPIVVLCSVSGVQLLMSKACASCQIAEDGLALLGLGTVTLTVALYAYAWVRGLRTANA